MKPSFAFLALPILFLTHSAFADEPESDSAPETSGSSAVRVSVVGTAALGSYYRAMTSPQSESGGGLGGELRIHPDSMSGAYFAAQTGGALFGPTLTTVDLGYSLRPFAPKRLKGVTAALYFDVGPSLGFVWVPQGFHNDLGGSLGAAFDVQIWNVTIGAQVSYHGGVPVDGGEKTQWESTVMGGLRLGFAFDIGQSDAGRPEMASSAR